LWLNEGMTTTATQLKRNRIGGYDVYVDGTLAGRVRQTDDEWNAAVWVLCPPSFMARELQTLPGSARKRSTAIADVVGAWYEDNDR